jgi:hypothetical protein
VGHHQAMTEEIETFIETKSLELEIFLHQKYIKMYAKYVSKNSLKPLGTF